jgi:hypothetical protein
VDVCSSTQSWSNIVNPIVHVLVDLNTRGPLVCVYAYIGTL